MNLQTKVVEGDEVWGFIGKKQKNTSPADRRAGEGDVWTWIALDAETKLVPSFAVGERTQYMADCFMDDLASRLTHRVYVSSNALAAYTGAIRRAFGCEADYGSIIKTFSESDVQALRENPFYGSLCACRRGRRYQFRVDGRGACGVGGGMSERIEKRKRP